MTSRVPTRLVWLGAILLAYCGLVALAYAVGPAVRARPAKPGCLIGGGGAITAANGDQSSFSILATSAPFGGASLYRDLGAKSAQRVHATSVRTLMCNAGATGATLAGDATVNGADLVTYRVRVELGSSAGAPGSYRIALSDGYDSGTQQIQHGALTIKSCKARSTRAVACVRVSRTNH